MRALSLLLALGCGPGQVAPETTAGPRAEAAALPPDACAGVDLASGDAAANLPWTPSAIDLELVRLSNGVYAAVDARAEASRGAGVPLATTAGVVVGDDGVLLVDTMLDRRLHCLLRALTESVTERPLRWAVNTSYHGDHSYGNAFLPGDVEIIQHAGTRAYIDAHFEEDLAFMTSVFGGERQATFHDVRATAPHRVVGVEGLELDLGAKRVSLLDFGFAQTGGDLFVWLPDDKVLFTGNPVIAEAPAIPWLLDGRAADVRASLARVAAFLPEDAVIVPGHGGPLAVADLRFGIAYLDALLAALRTVVEAGGGLADAREAAQLRDFQGYALWGFVHQEVNVPRTWAELAARVEPGVAESNEVAP